MKFVYIRSENPEFSTAYKSLKFICVDKQLVIDFTSVLPEDTPIRWTQIAGEEIIILNSTTISPTIVFPVGYSSSNENIILKLEAVNYEDVFLNLEIDTRLLSKSTSSPAYMKESPFLPDSLIPQLIGPSYSGDIYKDYFIYFNPRIHSTFTSSLYKLDDSLEITRIEWYENSNGVYSLVSTNKNFNHSVNKNVIAKLFIKLNEFREEIINTSILNDSLFRETFISGLANYRFSSIVNTSDISITRSNYLDFILNTPYNILDSDVYKKNSLVFNNSQNLINRLSYLDFILVTNYSIEDTDIKDKFSLSINNNETIINRNSYLLNGSGISIG